MHVYFAEWFESRTCPSHLPIVQVVFGEESENWWHNDPRSSCNVHERGKVDFCVLRVFCVKSTGPRAREKKYARRRMDFRSLFLRIFGLRTQACGGVPAKFFSQLLRRQTSPIGQKRSDDRSLLKQAVKALFGVALCEAEQAAVKCSPGSWLTANFQKKKMFKLIEIEP